MCLFYKRRGYPDSVVNRGKHCAQEIDRETALQASLKKGKNQRIPFTLTYQLYEYPCSTTKDSSDEITVTENCILRKADVSMITNDLHVA